METSEYENAILTTKPFKYLNIQELNIIIGYCRILTFDKNEILYKQGKQNDGMCIILKGSALVFAKTLGKDVINLGTLDVGNFFGEVSLIQKTSCAATVITNEKTECLLMTATYFDMLAVYYPEIRFKITKAINEEICQRLTTSYQTIKNIIVKTEITREPFPERFLKPKNKGIPEPTSFQAARLHRNDLLRSHFFKNYTENELDFLLKQSELMNFAKDFTIIQQGEEHSSYYLVVRGAVQLSIMSQNKKAKLTVLSPITIFGSLSFIINNPAMINFITCERALLLKISEKNLHEIEKSNKELWFKLYNSICESFVAIERAADKLMIRLNSELYNR